MFSKVHDTKDIQDGNKGSCIALVNYLTKERKDEGFFSHIEDNIKPEQAMLDIDNNKAQLSNNDAKFFMLSLNPSENEQKHLIGRDINSLDELTTEEKKKVFSKLENFTREAMNEYALNFHRDNIKSGNDLMYFAKIETQRKYTATDEEVKQRKAKIGNLKPGLQLHVHIIVSRKSKDGKIKLSPQAASKGNEWVLNDKIVKRGFCHEDWKINCGKIFDKMFNYQSINEEQYIKQNKKTQNDVKLPDDLKFIVENYKVTSVTHIYELMKERGWNHYFKYGQVFEKNGQKITLKTDILKEYVKDLPEETYNDIINRFNVYEYFKCPEKYNQNGICVKKTSFSSKQELSYKNKKLKIEENKGVKRINSYVLYDEKTKSTISASRLILYSLKHENISVYDRQKYIEALHNKYAKEAFDDDKISNINDFSNYLSQNGYTLNIETTKEYKLTDINFDEIYILDNTFNNTDIRSCLSDNKIDTIDKFVAAMEQRGYTSTTNLKGRYVFFDEYSNTYEFDSKVLYHSILRNAVSSGLETKEIINSLKTAYNCTQKVNTTFNYISENKKEIVSIDKYDFKKYLNKELPANLMADICSRFDLSQFKKRLTHYTDYNSDFIVEEKRSIINKGETEVPMISYVLTDKKTHLRFSLNELMTYARDNNIRLNKKVELNQISYDNLRESIAEM